MSNKLKISLTLIMIALSIIMLLVILLGFFPANVLVKVPLLEETYLIKYSSSLDYIEEPFDMYLAYMEEEGYTYSEED